MKHSIGRRLRRGLLPLLIFAVVTPVVLAMPSPSKQFYVNDFAGVLDKQTENTIYEQSESLYRSTTAQLVVVTVASLEGQEVSQYALELGRAWGVGSKDSDNGLLILLAPNERQIDVEVGYGLEGVFNDAYIGRMLDAYAVPHLKNNDWNAGVLELYNALLADTRAYYQGEEVSAPSASDDRSSGENSLGLPVAAIVLVVLLSLFSGFHRGGGFRRRRYFGGPFGGYGGGFGGHFGGGGGGFGGGGSSGGGGSFGGGGGSRGF